MIPLSPQGLQPEQWQQDLADAFNSPRELLEFLALDQADLAGVDLDQANPFPLRVPRYFARLMRSGDPHDPLLRQVLPMQAEHSAEPGYASDPVGDLNALRDTALLQKYRGRALAITTGACAVHCRYCFRRHFPYAEQSLLRHWQSTLETLAAMPDVDELILSGGDPLSLSDRRIATLLADTARLTRLRRLRLHTRLPVVLPGRVTPALCAMLQECGLAVVVVIHANHPNEITRELGAALAALRGAGATLLNQAVLLKDINDSADTLVRLSESLFSAGVLPYYLHLLDPVAGAAHFDVDESRAKALLAQLSASLPGYLVPKLVREVPGAPNKVTVTA
ncbi:MAG: EF-P beta-lysylation protein EpmB [Gammaproteobacteria bacterium]|nr:EF-P beta-lysylation protein EpmB [Gammaproteobacteria bacterium]